MPPEQFPWDRRDFRKHERSGSDPLFSGGGGGEFGGGWTNRWREHPHRPHAPLSFQNHQPPPPQPWYSDFRNSRPIPPGHGKQNGWHMYPDEAGHVFPQYVSRYNDRDVAEDNFRPFGSRGDGKYFRNNRENRGSFSQKDWRSNSWEPAVSSSGPGRPTADGNNQRVVENPRPYPKTNNQRAVENAQTCPPKMNNQRAVDSAQTCPKVNNQRAIVNSQTCPKVNTQKGVVNAQTCPKVNNQKGMANAQTHSKVINEKAAENAPTHSKVINEKAVENALTCPKANDEKAAENAQMHPEVKNQEAVENAQTCSKVNSRKAIENIQTCSGLVHQKVVENTQKCQNNNSEPNDSAHPNSVSSSYPFQTLQKEKIDKNDAATANPLADFDKNSKKENGLEAVDWKPLKWSRSGSLVSRSSGFSHSGSSKSLGVDSTEAMVDVLQKDVTPVQSPAVARAMPSAPDPSDEASSRKKPRLGWGEGLAKYEKKKVDVHEDDSAKDRLVVSVTSTETMLSPSCNLADKSPRFGNLSDCASPATPASVACSSSPGITGAEEKECIKAANVNRNTANLSCSSGIMSEICHEGSSFNFENLELTSVANVSSLIKELLNFNDPSSADTDYVRTTSMNKLLVCKADMLKALEVTESEIDSLETELKSLIAKSNDRRPCSAAYSSQSGECFSKPLEVQAAASGFPIVPAPLQIASNMTIADTPALEEADMAMQNEEIDSPGTATSKLVEAPSSGEDNCAIATPECAVELIMPNMDRSSNLNACAVDEDDARPVDLPSPDGIRNVHCDHIYETIITSNKESAKKSLEELNKLLPHKNGIVDSSIESRVSPSPEDSLIIMENFLARKKSLKFKEKVVALRYKVFQHFWKEGRVVSLRKLRGRSHKMFDLSLSRNGYKKNRSSIRSRISYFAGNHQIVPAEEVIKYVNGLLSGSLFKPCRTSLKMPDLILDEDAKMSRFISNNGLVKDPCAVEKERSIINLWTAEEQEIFIDKLAIFGKNFSEIASFLEHKTVADCIEFYYKNHKSECFERARKKPDSSIQSKSQATAYLVATGKRLNHEVNAVNLDILGEASIIAAAANDDMGTQRPKCTSRIMFGPASSPKMSRGEDGPLQRSNSLDMCSNETTAVDVLAGICGSLSSEAMSSCITSSFEPAERKCRRTSSSIKRPLTPEVTQNVDDECSDESCADVDTTDWTDEEKSVFIHAMSTYGKDFARVSQCVGTKTTEQCKIFFSKARKCLGLDQIHLVAGNTNSGTGNEGGSSDIEDGCVVQNGSVTCSDDLENKIEENLTSDEMKMDHTSDTTAESHKLKPDVDIRGEGSGIRPPNTVAAVRDSSLDDNPVVDLNAGDKEQNVAKQLELEESAMHVYSNSNSPNVERRVDDDLPDGLIETDDITAFEVSGGLVPEESRQNPGGEKFEHRDANLVDAALTSTVRELKSGLESCSAEKSCTVPSRHNGCVTSVPVESSTLFSVPIMYQRHLIGNASQNIGMNVIDKKYFQWTGGFQQQQRLEPGESSQILRGYPVPGPVPVHIGRHSDDFSLQKCKQSVGDKSRSQSGCSSDSDKPSRSGDVKLFGKILVSAQPEPNSCPPIDSVDKTGGSGGCQSLNLKLSSGGEENANLHSNNVGSNSFPVGSFCLWDGSAAPTGYPLLDSTLLLAKYPAAFANHSVVPREPSSNNIGLAEFPGLRSHLQPLSKETIFSEMQRRNAFDVLTGNQPQQVRKNNGDQMHYPTAQSFSDGEWRSR